MEILGAAIGAIVTGCAAYSICHFYKQYKKRNKMLNVGASMYYGAVVKDGLDGRLKITGRGATRYRTGEMRDGDWVDGIATNGESVASSMMMMKKKKKVEDDVKDKGAVVQQQGYVEHIFEDLVKFVGEKGGCLSSEQLDKEFYQKYELMKDKTSREGVGWKLSDTLAASYAKGRLVKIGTSTAKTSTDFKIELSEQEKEKRRKSSTGTDGDSSIARPEHRHDTANINTFSSKILISDIDINGGVYDGAVIQGQGGE